MGTLATSEVGPPCRSTIRNQSYATLISLNKFDSNEGWYPWNIDGYGEDILDEALHRCK